MYISRLYGTFELHLVVLILSWLTSLEKQPGGTLRVAWVMKYKSQINKKWREGLWVLWALKNKSLRK